MDVLQHIRTRHIWMTGIAFHVLAAWFSVGYFHPDEHFQLLEYASYKLGNTPASNLPWEFHAQMRPSLQVFIAYVVAGVFQFLDPFTTAFILRLLSAALALLTIYHAGKIFFINERHLRLYYLLALFLWFMPYQHVRFSSENWSGFMILFACIMAYKDRSLEYAGIFSGLAFCFRYQSAFFALGLFLWVVFIQKAGLRQALSFIGGFLLIFATGVCSDYWLYDQWVFTSYKYFYINLVEGKASYYGVEPFHYYILKIIESGIAPIGILLIAAFLWHLVKQPRSVFTWITLPFFILHCFIGHKELRFLFPLIYVVPFFMVTMLTAVPERGKFRKPLRVLFRICIIINIIILPFASFKASNPRIALLKRFYHEKEKPVCLRENPYFDVQWFSFYFPKHIDPASLQTVQTVDSVASGRMLIIPSHAADTTLGTLIYRQVPGWATKVNYGRWLERSNFWCVARKNQ